MPWKHAARDVVLVLITLGLWRWEAGLAEHGDALHVLIAIAAGSMAAVIGYLLHEWGHFLGGRLGGSAMRIPTSAREIFLFNFDSNRNSREQFLLMSSGGFVASALVILLFLVVLPLPSLASMVALGLTAAGVLATAILEVPPFWRVYRGGPIPRGTAYISTP